MADGMGKRPAMAEGNGGEEAEELEEGEIASDGESTSAAVNETASSKGIAAPPKHSLEHSWTFWFEDTSNRAKQAEWGASIRPIFTFSSIEDFWRVYNNIRHPSKLAVRTDLHCFKNKIEPKWEDPVCASGGTWTMNFPRGKSDTSWLYTLLAMIGEQFDHGDEVCGAVVNVRNKQERISIWTKNAANEAAQISIGRQWKEFLDYSNAIGFIVHDDAKKFDKAAKDRYTV